MANLVSGHRDLMQSATRSAAKLREPTWKEMSASESLLESPSHSPARSVANSLQTREHVHVRACWPLEHNLQRTSFIAQRRHGDRSVRSSCRNATLCTGAGASCGATRHPASTYCNLLRLVMPQLARGTVISAHPMAPAMPDRKTQVPQPRTADLVLRLHRETLLPCSAKAES